MPTGILSYPNPLYPPEYQQLTPLIELLFNDLELQSAVMQFLDEWEYELSVVEEKPEDPLVALWAIAEELREILNSGSSLSDTIDLDEWQELLADMGVNIRHSQSWAVVKHLVAVATTWWIDDCLEVAQMMATEKSPRKSQALGFKPSNPK